MSANKSLSVIYLASYFIQLLLLLLTISIFYSKSWKISDIEGDVIEVYDSTEGLFTKCQHFPNKYDCEDFDQFFIALPSSIIAARILLYISLTTQTIAVVIVPFAFECIKIVDDFHTRACFFRYAGILVGIGAISVGISVSWYAHHVIEEYFHHTEAGNYRYLWGIALYLGWIDMAGLLFIGLLTWFLPILEYKMTHRMDLDFEEKIDSRMENFIETYKDDFI